MRLLIIRHGDPDYEHDGLTETGKREAELLSERLAKMDISRYYVSSMGRAKATAAPTLERTGHSATECDWLREFGPAIQRPDTGERRGVAWDWLPEDWLSDPRFLSNDDWYKNEIFMSAGIRQYYDRVTAQFDSVLASYGYVRNGLCYKVEKANTDTLAFFCHFGVGCVLLSHLINVSPMVLWHGTVMAPSSVTTLITEERRPGTAYFRANAIGDTSHLYANGVQPSFAARFCEVYGNGDRID